MKRQTLLPMLISKVMHLLKHEVFNTLKGTANLKKVQRASTLLLEGWSESWSSVDVSELRYVSERQILSKLWTKM